MHLLILRSMATKLQCLIKEVPKRYSHWISRKIPEIQTVVKYTDELSGGEKYELEEFVCEWGIKE